MMRKKRYGKRKNQELPAQREPAGLHSASLAVSEKPGNGVDQLLSGRMMPYRYGRPSLDRESGRIGVDEALDMIADQYRERGEDPDTVGSIRQTWDMASAKYRCSLTFARIVFCNRLEARTALMLDGARSGNFPGWLRQAACFYGNLLKDPASLDDMGRFGCTGESLTGEFELVKKLASAYYNCRLNGRKPVSPRAPLERRRDDFVLQVDDLRDVFRILYAGESDRLREMGIEE
jgi:hypothetical protein